MLFFGLESAENQQMDFFADHGNAEKQDRLSVAMDEINRRFGRGSLFHLAEGIKRPWTMKREMLTPSYTTDWNQLPEVK